MLRLTLFSGPSRVKLAVRITSQTTLSAAKCNLRIINNSPQQATLMATMKGVVAVMQEVAMVMMMMKHDLNICGVYLWWEAWIPPASL